MAGCSCLGPSHSVLWRCPRLQILARILRSSDYLGPLRPHSLLCRTRGPLFGQAVGLVVIAFGAAVSFALAEDVEGTADVVSVADSAFAALALELVVVAHAQRHSLVSCCTVCHLCRVSLN